MSEQTATRKPTLGDWCETIFQIWIGKDGAIHYDSTFQKRWPGSWQRLMAAIENNSFNAADESDRIDWCAVQDEYESAAGESDE